MDIDSRYAGVPLSQIPNESWLTQQQEWSARQPTAGRAQHQGMLLFSDEEDDDGEDLVAQQQNLLDLAFSDEEEVAQQPPMSNSLSTNGDEAAQQSAPSDPLPAFSDEDEDGRIVPGTSLAAMMDLEMAFSDEDDGVAQTSIAAALGDDNMPLINVEEPVEQEQEQDQQNAAAGGDQSESDVARAHRERLAEERTTVRRAIETAVVTFLRDLRELDNCDEEQADADVSGSEALDPSAQASPSSSALQLDASPSPPSSQDSIMFAYSQDPIANPIPPPRPRRRARPRFARFSLATTADQEDDATRRRALIFPSSSPNSILRLAQLLRVLEEMACALTTGRLITKRDVYYRAPALFGKQSVVDRLVDGVVSKLGVRRSATGIVAAPKGLAAGCGSLYLSVGGEATEMDTQAASSSTSAAAPQQQQQQSLSAAHATSIPSIDGLERIETTAQWVLVVEKEAVFRTFLEARPAASPGSATASDDGGGGGIIMTGRGYPDLASREFLARLCEEKPALRVYTLVDADPYGMDISEMYRRSLPSSTRFQLLGISMVDVMSLQLSTQTLTPADRRKAKDMLAAADGGRCELSERVRFQLGQMLAQGVKAEIEAIDIAARRRREERGGEEEESEAEAEADDGLVEYIRAALGMAS